jgi:hypothetical protein
MRVLATLILGVIPAIAQQNFYPFTIDQDRLSGAPDFSSLNHPLTAADRLVVRNGHFCRAGDGTPVRLFGVNMVFGANFPEPADAPRIAKRLRRLGVNLVRCHHMDSSPDRDPANANSLLTTGPYPTLNPVSVARLRGFLDALKAEGIFANLNLHVGYQFRPDIDHVPPMPGQEFPKQSKPLHIFYPRMIDLQVQYTRKVIEALRLKNDPVLAMVEIDNETSLLEAWQRNSLDKYAVGEYGAELTRQWHAFKPGGGAPVPAKDAANDPRAGDWLLFLADRDRYYLDRMLGAVRESTDKLVPVTGTQMGYGGLLNLDSHAGLDFQDNHFYIDHYNFPHTSWDARDWRIRDSSAVGSRLTSYLNMAASREAGRPYTVSEFNEPWPNRHAAEIDPTLAAFGAFQDWDAIVHFAYSHSRHWENQVPSGFDINGDWSKFPNIGQSAWLFRSGAISAGKLPVRIPITPAMQLDAGRKRQSNVATYLTTAANFDPALALVHPVAIAKGAQSSTLPVAAAPYTSDTGQLSYDPDGKLFIVDTAEAAGVFGFLRRDKVRTTSVDVQLGPASGEFACVLVTARDGKALRQSKSVLISTPGYTLSSAAGAQPPRPQKFVPYPDAKDWWTLEPDVAGKPAGNRNGGVPPVWMERVESVITLRSGAKSMTVYPLSGTGTRLPCLAANAVKRVAGAFEIHLQADGQQFAPWYEAVGTF